MAQSILLKRSSVAGNVPDSSDLSLGEIAINTADGAVYIKKGNNDIVAVHDNDILHIDTTNSRVGIGTLSPGKPLDVVGDIRAKDSSDNQHQLRATKVISYGTDAILQAQSAGDDVRLNTENNVTRLIATAEGNVGIGDDSPDFKLAVRTPAIPSGSTYAWPLDLSRPNTDNRGLTFGVAASGTTNAIAGHNADVSIGHTFGTDSNGLPQYYETLRVQHIDQAVGRVGIGTTSPNNKLTVSGASDGINIIGSSSYLRWNSGDMMIRNEGSYAMGFHTYDGSSAMVERMRITSAGNVGIGKTSPGVPLHVASNSNILLKLESTSSSNNARMVFAPNSSEKWNIGVNISNHDFSWYDVTNAGTPVRFEQGAANNTLVVDSNSRIGIGLTGPTEKLHVMSGTVNTAVARFTGANNDRGLVISTAVSGITNDSIINYDAVSTNSVGQHAFKTDGTERVRIDASGRLGVGTTSPAEKLEVSGGHIKITNTGNTNLYINANNAGSDATIYFEEEDSVKAKIQHDASNDSMLFTDGALTDTMTLKSGQVGIGTTSPSSLLHVEGNFKVQNGYINLISSYPRIYLTDSGDNPDYQILNDNGVFSIYDGTNSVHRLRVASTGITFNNAYTFPTSDGSANQVLQTDGSGNLSFATVSGGGGSTNSITDADGDTKIQVEESSDEDLIRFDIAGSERMVLSSTGLGIQTSGAPTFGQLEVYQNGGTAAVTVHEDAGTGTARFHLRRGTGDTYLQNNSNGFEIRTENNISTSSTPAIKIENNGTTTFGYNTNHSAGVDVTGNITVTGTVDGRDIATDGSKLDGIEANATADQTASEILTAIKTVDGSGSGLDADLFDGLDSTSFRRRIFSTNTNATPETRWIAFTKPHISQSGTSEYYHLDLVGYSDIGATQSTLHYSAYIHVRGNGTSTNIFEVIIEERHKAGSEQFTFGKKQVASTSNIVYFILPEDYSGVEIYNLSDDQGSISTATTSMFSTTDTDPTGITTITPREPIHTNDNITVGSISSGNITSSGSIDVNSDAGQLQFGADNDMQIFHNGAGGEINNTTGNFTIDSVGDILLDADGGDIKLQDAGTQFGRFGNFLGSLAITSGASDTAIIIGDASGNVIMGGDVALTDNKRVKLGAGGDLELYHDGTDSLIRNYTSDLYIQNDADDKDIIIRTDNGSGGITEYMRFDGSDTLTRAYKTIVFQDNVKASFGNSEDMRIKHDGTDGSIDNYTGDLFIRNNADDKDIVLQSDDGSGGLATYIRCDGSTNQVKLNKQTVMPDSVPVTFGTSGDADIYHNGTHLYIDEKDAGRIFIRSSNEIRLNKYTGEYMIRAIADGAVTLYHDNSEKLATKSDGVDITGELQSDSLDVDGNADISGNLVLGGDLTVNGTTTTINAATLQVEDKNITLNYGSGDTSSSADGAGITIQDAVDASNDATILWDATNDEFDFSHAINTAGAITAQRIIGTQTNGSSLYALELTRSGGGTTTPDIYGTSGTFVIGSSSSDEGIAISGQNSFFHGELNVPSKIIHSGDTDTYFEFTANEQDFVVGGVTGLHMDSSRLNINPNAGNYDFRVSGDNDANLIYADASTDRVGIGNSSPPQKLTVNGAVFITDQLTSPGSAGTYTYNGTAVDYSNNGTRYWSWGSGTARGTFNFIQLENDGTNQQTAMSIDTSGNVGIGTTTPSQPLTVTGADSVGIDDYVLHNGDTDTKFGFNAADSFKVRTGGGDRFVVNNNDSYFNNNVGVGTSSPAALFNVNSSSTIGWSNLANAYILAGTTTNGIGIDSNEIAIKGDHIYVGTIDAKDIVMRTNGANERMRVLSGGQVGINTSSAFTTGGTARLTIKDSSVAFTYGNSNSDLVYHRRTSAGVYQQQTWNSSNSGQIQLQPYGGQVGIGTTTASATLQVEEYGIDTTSTSSTATTQIAIHTFAAATFRSARFTVQVTNSTDSTYHTTELLLVHDGTTANITEFGEIHTGSAVEATFDADISSGNVRLLATPASTDTMAFKVVCHSITT